MSTFVLIHGAWHGAWCWRKTIPLLEAAGHKVIAPDLPSHGDDKTPASQVTLQTYVDKVCQVLRAQTEPVILAGHSMGGMVITQAAEQCPEKIRSLVYICAFLPRNGDSLQAWASLDPETMVNPNTLLPNEDHTVSFRMEFAKDAFYGKCSEEDAVFAMAHLTRQSGTPMGVPVATTEERYGKIPRDYIHCTEDRAITIELQRKMRQASPCRRVYTLDADHSPFFSAPQELADALLAIAGA